MDSTPILFIAAKDSICYFNWSI